MFCIFGPNLVILAWTGPEFSREQASGWYTHTHTDSGNDNTRRADLAWGKPEICRILSPTESVNELFSKLVTGNCYVRKSLISFRSYEVIQNFSKVACKWLRFMINNMSYYVGDSCYTAKQQTMHHDFPHRGVLTDSYVAGLYKCRWLI